MMKIYTPVAGRTNKVASLILKVMKVATCIAADVAVDKGVNALIDKACDKIEVCLKNLYKRTARNSIISFVINLLGILCLGIKPFGKKPSIVIAYLFFAAAMIFFLIRSIRFVKAYSRQGLDISRTILKTKSIHKGIEKYVYSKFPLISLTYTGINMGEMYLPSLRKIPRIPQLIDCFAGLFWKRLAIYGGIVVSYSIIIFWIIKPILIYRFMR